MSMTLPQVRLLIKRQAVRDAERDLAQLYVIHNAVAPLAPTKDNSGSRGFREIANALRAIIWPKKKK